MKKSRIKILFHIDTITGGGAERVLCNLLNNMDQNNFDITVQTLFPSNDSSILQNGIRVKSIFPKHTKYYHFLYRIETALGLTYALHMRDDYDIECAYLECGPTKVIAFSNNKKAKKIAWIHNNFSSNYENPEAFANKTRKIYRRFDRIICITKEMKNSFLELFQEDYHVDVLHNTIDSRYILENAEEKLNFTSEIRPIIAYVGRLSQEKSIMRLLTAFRNIRQKGLNAELWIIGDGEDRQEAENFIEYNKLKNVKLFGYCNNPYPYIKNSDILVCQSNSEGYSTCVAEALILGTPVVATDCGGMHDLLGNSEYGLITECNDQSFEVGLEMFIRNEQLRNEYSVAAIIGGKRINTEKTVFDTERYFNLLVKDM